MESLLFGPRSLVRLDSVAELAATGGLLHLSLGHRIYKVGALGSAGVCAAGRRALAGRVCGPL